MSATDEETRRRAARSRELRGELEESRRRSREYYEEKRRAERRGEAA